MFKEPNDPQKIAIQLANTKFCIGADRVANRLMQLSKEIAATRSFCEQPFESVDRLHEQLSTLKSQCKESAKLITALKDQSTKASNTVYRTLADIDAAVWQLPGLVNALDSTPLCAGLLGALEDLRVKVLELKEMLVDLQSFANRETSAKVYSWTLFVYSSLSLLSFAAFATMFGMLDPLFGRGLDHMTTTSVSAAILLMITGIFSAMIFAMLVARHLDFANPRSEYFSKERAADSDSDSPQRA